MHTYDRMDNSGVSFGWITLCPPSRPLLPQSETRSPNCLTGPFIVYRSVSASAPAPRSTEPLHVPYMQQPRTQCLQAEGHGPQTAFQGLGNSTDSVVSLLLALALVPLLHPHGPGAHTHSCVLLRFAGAGCLGCRVTSPWRD